SDFLATIDLRTK
ncbi:hypothetical protein AB1N83_014417, partial [Pleurotus pulmonarius]